MIYRIRIMRLENGVLVFDRYATDKELLYLKPKADGNGVVELECIMCDVMRIFETDVSATHFVEWGEDVDALRTRIAELEKRIHNAIDDVNATDKCMKFTNRIDMTKVLDRIRYILTEPPREVTNDEN